MKVRESLRRGRAFALGAFQRRVLGGAAVTAALFLLGVTVLWPSQPYGTTGIRSAALAGVATGLTLNRGWYRGAVVGCRAVLVGFALLAVVVPVGLFAMWQAQSGQSFLFLSPFLGGVLLLLTPVYALVGAIGGVAGALVRRGVESSDGLSTAQQE